MRIRPPVMAPDFEITDITGRSWSLGQFRGHRLMLSFFRDASCPFCNLRVYELADEYNALSRQGMHIVTLFRSTGAQVRQFVARRPRPFIMAADPEMRVFRPYGIELSWGGMLRTVMLRMPRMMAGLRLSGGGISGSGPNLLPADFLIDSFGFVRRAYYGRDLGDHLPIEDIRAFAAMR